MSTAKPEAASEANASTLLRVGTRESQLAMVQTHHVIHALGRDPRFVGMRFEVVPQKSLGDVDLLTPLSELGRSNSPGRFGVFVKELEKALLAREVDLAVHSLKDMPSEIPAGLALLPFGTREDVRDAFIAADGETPFFALPEGATVGTSSIRRMAQLRKLRPDLNYINIRGNVQTRLKKLEQEPYDGMLLAMAGLKRLGLSHLATHCFSPETELVPAVGQGVLGLEFREGSAVAGLLNALVREQAPEALVCVAVERGMMRRLEGGCQLPLGCYARLAEDGEMRLTLHLIAPDASLEVRRDETLSPALYADEVALHKWLDAFVQEVLAHGGQRIKEMISA